MFAQGCWATTAARDRAYALLCLGLFGVALLFGFTNGRHHRSLFTLVESDARLYYAYLPSVVLDGDLDFSNQIREHWDIDFDPGQLDDKTPTGLVRNKHPIGMALTLTPAFVVAHLTAQVSGVRADGYSWPYQIFCVAQIQLLVWLTLRRIDRILVDRLALPAAAFYGVVVVVLATPYVYYATREPFLAHVISTFWCTEFVFVATNPALKPRVFWPRLAFAAAMAVVCRPTNLFLLPIGLLGVARRIRSDGWGTTLLALPLAIPMLFPIGLQMWAWRILDGSWISYSYGEEGFDWLHPVLLKTLFSSRHGLFSWSPILLFAVAALVWWILAPSPPGTPGGEGWGEGGRHPTHRTHPNDNGMKSPRAMLPPSPPTPGPRSTGGEGRLIVACWLLGALGLWYANSAWHCWWFGAAFGARAFLELTGLFAVGLALSFRRWPRFAVTLAAVAISWNGVLAFLYVKQWIPHESAPFSW